MIIKNVDQGSQEWHQLRTGMPSASKFKEIVTGKGEPSKSRQKYLYQLAGERITGKREETYQNAAMVRGLELEPDARNLFSMVTGYDVAEVGMCVHDSGLFSCSPDGLLSAEIGLEIKCPNGATHVEYLIGNKVPAEYYQQVHGSMLVTGYSAWFFVSYFPGIKPFIHLEERDNAFCEKLLAELLKFAKELDEVVEKIKL